MEHSQLSQMIAWLDQAHQQDRAEISQLQEQVERLIGERDENAKRLMDAETQLAALQTRIDRIGQVETFFERFKLETNAMLEQGETRRQQTVRDGDRIRQTEIENLTKSIAEVRREVQTYQRYGEEAATRRIEIQRLAGDIARLQQQVLDVTQEAEESRRGRKLLEQQRHQDLNRITELQAQTADILKRNEAILPRLQYLEQLPPRLTELQASAQEVKLEQSKHLEKVQFLEAQIERQVRGWAEEIVQYRQRMDEFARLLEQYAEDHQLIKKAMEDLNAFQEQIKRQQHEMSELQRLSQSHQKSEFTEWQAQAEQLRQQQQADWDRQWSDYEKIMADWTERIESMQGLVAENEHRLRQLLQMAEEDAELRAATARDWQERFEQIISED